MAKRVATIVGAVFLLAGLIGFVRPGLLNFHLSPMHNLIHLVSGATSLYFGLSGSLSGARLFCILFGATYGLLGLVGFVAGSSQSSSMPGMAATDSRLLKIAPGVFELGTVDHTFHITVAVAYLVAGLLTKTVVDRAASARA